MTMIVTNIDTLTAKLYSRLTRNSVHFYATAMNCDTTKAHKIPFTVSSGFRSGVTEIVALMGCHAAQNGSL